MTASRRDNGGVIVNPSTSYLKLSADEVNGL